MNVLHIYPGSEYAVLPNGKPKGDVFVPGAVRVRVLSTFKVNENGKARSTAYIRGLRMTRDGDVVSGDMVEYRAYDVVEDWDEYDDRWQKYEVDAEERERERKERYEAQNREYEARRERERIERETRERVRLERRQKVMDGFESSSLPGRIDNYNEQITMTFDEFLAWLDSQEKQSCRICAREVTIIRRKV